MCYVEFWSDVLFYFVCFYFVRWFYKFMCVLYVGDRFKENEMRISVMVYIDVGSSELNDDLFDLRMLDEVCLFYDYVKKFIVEVVDLMLVKFYEFEKGKIDIWFYVFG